MILTAGEALIDMVMQPAPASHLFAAKVGGAPLNAAMALGRLDVPVKFACPISTDNFGDMIVEQLTASNVGLAAPVRVFEPSPLAIVTVNAAGVPSYSFHREGTADRQIDDSFIAQCLDSDFNLLHVGGTALSSAIDFGQWLKLIVAAKDRGALVSIDPNMRPALIDDLVDYQARMAVALAHADIIKASDEDCDLLFGHADFEALCADNFAAAKLVVMTQGAKDCVAKANGKTALRLPVAPVTGICDTVGAGDCFQAGMLSVLWRAGSLASADSLGSMDAETLSGALTFGNKVAAFNCQQDGCNPPYLHELA